jgi:hypothetical protein
MDGKNEIMKFCDDAGYDYDEHEITKVLRRSVRLHSRLPSIDEVNPVYKYPLFSRSGKEHGFNF